VRALYPQSTTRSNASFYLPSVTRGVPFFSFLLFSFKPNPNSSVTTFVDEKTGEEKERLINKGRWKGFGPTSVSFFEKAVGEPLLR
jgi:general transcription factor 3C polypeptide 5 (transcription factor C subunit 1)